MGPFWDMSILGFFSSWVMILRGCLGPTDHILGPNSIFENFSFLAHFWAPKSPKKRGIRPMGPFWDMSILGFFFELGHDTPWLPRSPRPYFGSKLDFWKVFIFWPIFGPPKVRKTGKFVLWGFFVTWYSDLFGRGPFFRVGSWYSVVASAPPTIFWVQTWFLKNSHFWRIFGPPKVRKIRGIRPIGPVWDMSILDFFFELGHDTLWLPRSNRPYFGSKLDFWTFFIFGPFLGPQKSEKTGNSSYGGFLWHDTRTHAGGPFFRVGSWYSVVASAPPTIFWSKLDFLNFSIFDPFSGLQRPKNGYF